MIPEIIYNGKSYDIVYKGKIQLTDISYEYCKAAIKSNSWANPGTEYEHKDELVKNIVTSPEYDHCNVYNIGNDDTKMYWYWNDNNNKQLIEVRGSKWHII